MRVFETLYEAESEIRRDLYKGPLVQSTRVQQQTNLSLQVRERLGYQYSVSNVPTSIAEITRFGSERFPSWRENQEKISLWLQNEVQRRFYNYHSSDPTTPDCSEVLHPQLKTTLEGNFPAYTYQARMRGAVHHLANGLKKNPDTRRAYWPIYHEHDVLRFADPTRIPCSLGYQPLIRDLGNGEERLVMFYLERSCDFDHFWLSDVFFASYFQKLIAQELEIKPGALLHYIISFHSFEVEEQEIY